MKISKYQFLYNEMHKAGLTDKEAICYLIYNDRCNFESIVRRWRKHAAKEDKNYEAEEAYRQEYSPVTHVTLNAQEKKVGEAVKTQTNQSLF